MDAPWQLLVSPGRILSLTRENGMSLPTASLRNGGWASNAGTFCSHTQNTAPTSTLSERAQMYVQMKTIWPHVHTPRELRGAAPSSLK